LNTSLPDTLIRNARLILTMDPALGAGSLGAAENLDILIRDGKIDAVAPRIEAAHARVVDASGCIVMPGFVDTHNHLWQCLIRGWGAACGLMEWLETGVGRLQHFRFSESDAFHAARLATLDLINSGITTTVDWSHAFSPEFVHGNLRALAASGMCYAFVHRGSAAAMAEIRSVHQALIAPDPRAELQLACRPGMAPELMADLEAMRTLGDELNARLHVHLLEIEEQRADRPLQALQAAGLLGPGLICAHAVHLDDAELELLAECGAGLVHNPLSNMRTGAGVMRLGDAMQRAIPVALGLDGGTNDSSDMFANMRAAVGLQRASRRRADVSPTPAEVLRMATAGGAELLGRFHEFGSISRGKRADLIILRPETLNFAPWGDPVAQIVFNARPGNVEWVFIDGRVRKERGRLADTDMQQAIAEVQEVADRVRQFLCG
jgi:5-methylthioadenosine/S-adenosylhomocysteine deaminase